MDPINYGSIMKSGQELVPDFAAQEAQRQLMALRTAEIGAQLSAAKTKIQRQQQFTQAMEQYVAHPTPDGLAQLFGSFPEYADQAKAAWGAIDKSKRESDATALGEITSLAAKGGFDRAAEIMSQRIEADKKAGIDTADEEYVLEGLKSGDKQRQKEALGWLTLHLGVAVGPEHAKSFLEGVGLSNEGYTLTQGAARFGSDNAMIAHSPFIEDADGNIRLWTDAPGGGEGDQPATGVAPSPPPADPDRVAAVPAGLPAPQAAVASTLAAGGLPPPVVAGFLGNFHAEGGYGGAKGDGGTAHGIGQWRDDRAATFQKVVGKPVSEATPAEQAGFVLWELQNPEKAGMTQGQVDAIMAAKTPAQAAALIDQFYERSSGIHRQKRMAAAAQYAGVAAPGTPEAGGQFPILFKSKGKDAPTGYEWTDDSHTTLRPITGGPADAQAALDPATIGFYADQILAGGQMPTLGMGKQAAAARQAIMREVARKARALGIQGGDLATQQAHYANAKKALGVLETQATTIEANENTAIANGQQFLDRSKELTLQTKFPIVNSATQTYLRHTGDPTIAAMDAAWNTFTTEYAKVIGGSPSGAGVLSDSARHEAMSIMRGNYSLKQKEAAFKQMQQDMANRMAAIRAGIAHGYKNMTSIPGSTRELTAHISDAGLPKGAKVVGTYQGKRVIQLPNGKRMVEE